MLRAFFDYVVIRFQICIFDILNTAGEAAGVKEGML